MHKDFHATLSFCMDFMIKNYGMESLEEFLKRVARRIYTDLSTEIKKRGLCAMKEHLVKIFTDEEGEYEVTESKDSLTFKVKKCPAISYIKDKGLYLSRHHCLNTAIVNDEIMRKAGYKTETEYDLKNGTCVQRFYR